MENLCAKIDGHFRPETIRSPKSHDVQKLTESNGSCLELDGGLKTQDGMLRAGTHGRREIKSLSLKT